METIEESTKLELNNLLTDYKSIYSKRIIEYMRSLLELETSILKNNIYDINEFKILTEVELFRKIFNYNIYYKTIDIYRKFASDLRVYDKLELECIKYRSSENVYLKNENKKELLMNLYKFPNNSRGMNGYEINYYVLYDNYDENDIFNKFSENFEQQNDISKLSKECTRIVLPYENIGSRLVKTLRRGRND